jgi:hypothetical protein
MIIINGERVWVPHDRQDLVTGLQRMGIHKVAGLPLAQLSVKQLTAAYCRERARIVRRRQGQRRAVAQPAADAVQFELLPH